MTAPVAAPVLARPVLYLHQREAEHAVCAKVVAGHRRQIVVLATGGGKTVMFALLPRALRRHTGMRVKRVLVLAHRQELLTQAARTFARCEPRAKIGLHVADARCHAGDYDVVIASVQSIAREDHLHAYAPDTFQLIVIDEAHHAVADGAYARVARYFRAFEDDGPLLFGFTATPMRADGRSLADLFEVLAYAKTLEDGMNEGWLSPARYLRVPISADLLSVKRGQDFDRKKLAALMDQPAVTYTMLARYRHHREEMFAAEGRYPKTIAFAVSRQHAAHIAEACLEMGIPALTVWGDLPKQERKERLAAFAENRVEVLVSVNLLLEGFDDPEVTCSIDLKPTRSLVLATQEFGRGIRRHPGKREAVYLQAVPEHASEAGMIQVPQLFGLTIDWNATLTDVVESTPLHELNERLAEAQQAAEGFAFLASVDGRADTRDDDDIPEPLTVAEREAIIASALAMTPEAVMQLTATLPDGFRTSDVLWQPRPDGSCVVAIPRVGTLTVAPPDLLGNCLVDVRGEKGHHTIADAPTLDAARRVAERWLAMEHPEASQLVFRSQAAKWMEKPASAEQCAELTRRLPDVSAARFKRLRRGVASALLDYLAHTQAAKAAKMAKSARPVAA